jgi:RNA polymerase sigma-70 factor, ECF subfamily
MPAELGAQIVSMLPRLRRYALAVSRDRDVADDLVQTACEKALAAAQGPGLDVPFEAWMFTILRHAWVDRQRKLQVQGVTVDIEDHQDERATPSVEHELSARSEMQQVQQAMGELPQEQREVLELVCIEQLSYKDAAQQLGIPLGTVMSRLARARLKLASLLGRSLPSSATAQVLT